MKIMAAAFAKAAEIYEKAGGKYSLDLSLPRRKVVPVGVSRSIALQGEFRRGDFKGKPFVIPSILTE